MSTRHSKWGMCTVVTQLLSGMLVMPKGVAKLMTHESHYCKEWLARVNERVDELHKEKEAKNDV